MFPSFPLVIIYNLYNWLAFLGDACWVGYPDSINPFMKFQLWEKLGTMTTYQWWTLPFKMGVFRKYCPWNLFDMNHLQWIGKVPNFWHPYCINMFLMAGCIMFKLVNCSISPDLGFKSSEHVSWDHINIYIDLLIEYASMLNESTFSHRTLGSDRVQNFQVSTPTPLYMSPSYNTCNKKVSKFSFGI